MRIGPLAWPWLSGSVRALRSAAHWSLDLIFPPTCLACSNAVEKSGGLCSACWASVRFIERPYCERLGTPFETDYGGVLISPAATADPPVYGRARAVARFEDGPTRRLVHRLKYADRVDLAGAMAAWMTRAGRELIADADVIAPFRSMRRDCARANSTKPPRWRPASPGALESLWSTRRFFGSKRQEARSA